MHLSRYSYFRCSRYLVKFKIDEVQDELRGEVRHVE